MMNNFIARILSKPGRYAISSLPMIAFGAYFPVEVDAAGKVWQISPSGERDGELRPDGWKGDEFVLDVRSLDVEKDMAFAREHAQ